MVRARTTKHTSKNGYTKVLRRVLQKGSWASGGACPRKVGGKWQKVSHDPGIANFLQFFATFRSLKNHQYSTEGQKFHANLAPVLVISAGNSLVFPGKLLPVLAFTGIAPPTYQHR